jgi:hypothetical protein
MNNASAGDTVGTKQFPLRESAALYPRATPTKSSFAYGPIRLWINFEAAGQRRNDNFHQVVGEIVLVGTLGFIRPDHSDTVILIGF